MTTETTTMEVQWREDEYAGQWDGGEMTEIGYLKVDGDSWPFYSLGELEVMQVNYRCHGSVNGCDVCCDSHDGF